MIHSARRRYRFAYNLRIANIGVRELNPTRKFLLQFTDVPFYARTRQAVENVYWPVVLQVAACNIGADESGPAGNQNVFAVQNAISSGRNTLTRLGRARLAQ